jgi:hypothetical protein
LVRHGKGDKRREAGMDEWGFEQLNAWLTHRVLLRGYADIPSDAPRFAVDLLARSA